MSFGGWGAPVTSDPLFEDSDGFGGGEALADEVDDEGAASDELAERLWEDVFAGGLSVFGWDAGGAVLAMAAS
ncbi:MAG: hypothetical protein KF861_05490, partial [Planctomycetaceae bacterium]|nr:hypothetical protein [Planctomycetaceae bacterium]